MRQARISTATGRIANRLPERHKRRDWHFDYDKIKCHVYTIRPVVVFLPGDNNPYLADPLGTFHQSRPDPGTTSWACRKTLRSPPWVSMRQNCLWRRWTVPHACDAPQTETNLD